MILEARWLAAAAALLLAASARAAGLFDGPLDTELVGEWTCGDTEIAITSSGSIALDGESKRAGLVSATNGRLEIAWDGGERSAWDYAAGGGALILATDRGANYACLAVR